MLGPAASDPRHVFTRTNGTHLFLGDFNDAKNLDWLRRMNITAIVNATETLPNKYLRTIQYYRLPIQDSVEDAQNLAKSNFLMLTNVVNWVNGVTLAGNNVLIHCKSGKNRSAKVMIAFLLTHESRRVRGRLPGLDYYIRYVGQKASRRTDPLTGMPVAIISYDPTASKSLGSAEVFRQTLRLYEEYLYPPRSITRPGPRRNPGRAAKRPRTT